MFYFIVTTASIGRIFPHTDYPELGSILMNVIRFIPRSRISLYCWILKVIRGGQNFVCCLHHCLRETFRRLYPYKYGRRLFSRNQTTCVTEIADLYYKLPTPPDLEEWPTDTQKRHDFLYFITQWFLFLSVLRIPVNIFTE